MKKRSLHLVLVLVMMLCVLSVSAFAEDALTPSPVAEVGGVQYSTIGEAVAKWTANANTTLTLLSDVTLDDVITLKSTEHHILNLGTHTMTAAAGKNAIEIIACGTGNAERSAITVNADAVSPGGINAGTKSCIYYNYSNGGISENDRPIIKINGGVFTGGTSASTSAGIYFKGTATRKAATLNVAGGTFNCAVYGPTKSKLIISGGTFHYSVGSQGDSTAYRLISGGRFKSFGFFTADSNNTKFWIGTQMGTSNVGVYVDDEGYLVVGGPVITEPGDKFTASSTNYGGWNSNLKYSSAASYGLYYTSVSEALAANKKNTDTVTVYRKEINLTDTAYKGEIKLPADQEQITVTFSEGTEPVWHIEEADDGGLRVYTQVVESGTVTRVYDVITPKVSDASHGSVVAGTPTEADTYVLTAVAKTGHWFVGWTDQNNNVVSTEPSYAFSAYNAAPASTGATPRFIDPPLTAMFAVKNSPSESDFAFAAPVMLTYDGTAKSATVSVKSESVGMGTVTVKYYDAATSVPLDGAPINVGEYIVGITVAEGERYLASTEEITGAAWRFAVTKASQNAPAVSAQAETVSKKADGKILGTTVDMEYRKDGVTSYTPATAEAIANLEAGTYFVRYKGDDNHEPSADTEVTVAAGRKLRFTLPQNTEGYTVRASASEYDWNADATVYFELHNGYSKLENFKYMLNGTEIELTDGAFYSLVGMKEDYTVTVEGVADITVPTVVIKLNSHTWNKYSNGITFNMFYNEPQEISFITNDEGSGVHLVAYYLASEEMTEDELAALTDWEEYNGAFTLSPNNCYAVYVKVVDKAGNTVYVNSDGMVFDDIAPELEGIANGKVYYGDLRVVKAEENDIKSVTLDGEEMAFAEGRIGWITADNKQHTVVAEDLAGNKSVYTVTVYKNYTVTFIVDGEVLSTETVGYGNDATLPLIPEKEGYTQIPPAWDNDGKNITKDTEISAAYTVNEYSVTVPEEQASYKLEIDATEAKHGEEVCITVSLSEGYRETDAFAVKVNGVAVELTEDNKITLSVTSDMVITVEGVELKTYTVTFTDEDGVYKSVTVKHGETVTMPEPPAKEGYTVKWESAVDTVSSDTTVKAVYTKDVTADTQIPQTDDSVELCLWFVLLVTSGTAIVLLPFIKLKRAR